MIAAAPGAPVLLSIDHLTIAFPGPDGPATVVKDVTLSLGRGEILGLVGESGSGKTTLLMAITNYLPAGARRLSGTISLGGRDLLGAARADLDMVRGRRIAMVYQDPTSALNPTMPIGRQAIEVRTRHFGEGAAVARRRLADLFREVGLEDAERIGHSYPHEISGGQRQRVMIAMALAGEPDVILMDEPTTALDVIVQARLLRLIGELRTRRGLSVLFVSHDLGAVATVADRVAVLYRGEVMEVGPVAEVLTHPRSDYARRLLQSVPRLDRAPVRPAEASPPEAPLLEGVALSVDYAAPGLLARLRSRRVRAVRLVSFALHPGRVLAVVGESGSGKSTLARALLRLLPVSSGRVSFKGADIAKMSGQELRRFRREVAIVFQNPTGSLNPRKRVRDIVARPLIVQGQRAAEAHATAGEMLAAVGLPAAFLSRYPAQLSGGEKQRVAIARAFVTNPSLIILDEPTTALDVSVQAAILALLAELKARTRCAYLFISHDLAVVSRMADDILVMRNGEACETGPVLPVFSAPQHAYTRSLLDAAVTL